MKKKVSENSQGQRSEMIKRAFLNRYHLFRSKFRGMVMNPVGAQKSCCLALQVWTKRLQAQSY